MDLGTSDGKEIPKVEVTLDIYHYRDGKLLEHVSPYSKASLLERVLFHVGLKNLTRSA